VDALAPHQPGGLGLPATADSLGHPTATAWPAPAAALAAWSASSWATTCASTATRPTAVVEGASPPLRSRPESAPTPGSGELLVWTAEDHESANAPSAAAALPRAYRGCPRVCKRTPACHAEQLRRHFAFVEARRMANRTRQYDDEDPEGGAPGASTFRLDGAARAQAHAQLAILRTRT